MGRLPASVSTPHSLADLVELQRGYDLTAAERMPGQIPVIGGGGPNGTHDTANVSGPGVVVVRSGSGFGNVWWVNEDFWAHNTVMFAKSFKGNHKKFAYYVLDWLDFTSYNSGGAQPSLNRNFIYAIPVFLPSPPEQARIAGIIETWDCAIETVEALIANVRAQKQALMQQLLTGKRRLPGFDLPWKERALESIFQFKKGQGLSKGAVIPEGVRPCILYGELYTRYPEVIREVVSRTNANDGFPSKSGDVLIPASTTTTGIDLANATAILENDVLLSGDINILRPKNTKQSAPFFAYLLTHILKHKIASRAQGITIVHLYGAHLKPLTVTVPDVEEQHAIASIIMDADDEILRLEAQLTALRQEKAALMQQLLTGKRRVKLPESEVA